jgi:GrpB-like predicted nucleotidyltransferase (UPF0157 family)
VGPWTEPFAREGQRVLGALGEMTEGGIIERAEHVGSTSVPGLLGRPCLDIALATWPFPLEERSRQALSSLGYDLDPAFAGAPEQRFRHASGKVQLWVVEAGSPLWTDFLLMRDYLRQDEAARQHCSAIRQGWDDPESPQYREVKQGWFERHLDDARRAWIERERFSPLHLVAEELRDYPGPWHICGGWALDLFLGRVTRVHHDVDVQVARADQLALQEHLWARGWKLLTPLDGRLEPWPRHMRLELPRHQVHAHRRGRFIDFLLAELDGGVWRYRRDPSILQDLGRVGLRSEEGIPFLAPELALLYKSKNTSGRERGKDQADFEGVSSMLAPERRAWLRWALLAVDPSHPWIERLCLLEDLARHDRR